MAAFGSVAGATFRSAPLLTRRCPTSQVSLPISSPAFHPSLQNASTTTSASPLSPTSLLFQKPPSSGGGGGFFSRFGGGGGSGDPGDGGGGGNPFLRLASLYLSAQSRWPIRTKAASTLVLSVLGDLVAQRIAARRAGVPFSLDGRRTAAVGAWAFCFMGPVLHHWFGALDRVFVGRGRAAVGAKVACDQLLFAPPFNAAFIGGVGALEGETRVVARVRGAIGETLRANWMLWPAAQAVNFALVPREWQMIYVNTVALGWSVALAYITHKGDAGGKEAGGGEE